MFRQLLPLSLALLPIGLMPVAGPLAAAALTEETSTVPDRLIASHNSERVALGLSEMVWDPALADAARHYAREMAATDGWRHSSPESRGEQGENLWRGTRGAFAIEEMVDGWLEERSMFKSGTFPSVSTTGNWEDVGHYTQIIWHGDRRVGCAIDSSAAYDYLVCRYSRPGNVMGEAVMVPRQLASAR
jgi:hypothetical protein